MVLDKAPEPVPEERVPDELSPALLDASGAIVGRIIIANNDIFDLENPKENKALYRLANRLHATTKGDVIRQQLLFEPGDPFSVQQIEETERILRKNRYLQDAAIEPIRNEDGVVDLRVVTSDVWTLMPRLSFARSGGTNSSGVGIKETNLFGTGTEIEVLYRSDVDRDSKLFQFADRQFRNSWYALDVQYEDNSDGNRSLLELGKPFYSLDARNAHGIRIEDFDRIDSLYDRGEVTGRFRHEGRNHEIAFGWSPGLENGWSRRIFAGLGVDEHRFAPVAGEPAPSGGLPDDRRLVYPFVGVEWIQDDFAKSTNLDQIERTEDRFLGTAFRGRLGLATPGLGSDREAVLVDLGARTSFGRPETRFLTLNSNVSARLQSDGTENLLAEFSTRYYRRHSDKRLFFAELRGTLGQNLDLERQILLGGDNGLRGYPLRFQSGDRQVLLTLEERLFTDWYPFRLFRIGGAVFFDAGRAWGGDADSGPNAGMLKDVGLGLRIGNPRSGRGHVAHVDLAYPLDGDGSFAALQVLVSVKESF